MGVRASKLVRLIAAPRAKQRLLGGPPPIPPKGYVPVCVGLNGDVKQFIVQMKAFGDADFMEFLYKSAEEYGFCNEGVLRIPYEAKEFEKWMRKMANQKMIRVKPV